LQFLKCQVLQRSGKQLIRSRAIYDENPSRRNQDKLTCKNSTTKTEGNELRHKLDYQAYFSKGGKKGKTKRDGAAQIREDIETSWSWRGRAQ
jgi:hypothetical protein